MKRVSTTISNEDDALLTRLEDERGMARADVLRQLIREGLADWRKEKALAQLSDGYITLRQAAELAEVSYVEMLSLASDEGVDIGYATTDLDRDLNHGR